MGPLSKLISPHARMNRAAGDVCERRRRRIQRTITHLKNANILQGPRDRLAAARIITTGMGKAAMLQQKTTLKHAGKAGCTFLFKVYFISIYL